MGKSGNGSILIVFAVLLFIFPSSFQDVFAGMVCTEVYEPVCGIDGVTYSNECKAASNGVNVAHTGECDTTPPTVKLSSPLPQDRKTGSGYVEVTVTATFSEDVTGFELGDVVLVGDSANKLNFKAVSGSVYTFDVYWPSYYTLKVTIPAGVATNSDGNDNLRGEISISGDIDPPSLQITSTKSSPTQASPIPMTATFNEAVTGFELGDVIVGNGYANNFVAVSGSVYTFDLIPTSAGIVTVDVAANVATDAVGIGNTAAAQFSIESNRLFVIIDFGSWVPYTSVNSYSEDGFTLSRDTRAISGGGNYGNPKPAILVYYDKPIMLRNDNDLSFDLLSLDWEQGRCYDFPNPTVTATCTKSTGEIVSESVDPPSDHQGWASMALTETTNCDSVSLYFACMTNDNLVLSTVIPTKLHDTPTVPIEQPDYGVLLPVEPTLADNGLVPEVVIPQWVKEIAGLWCADEIGSSDFVQVIQWMIKEGLIMVPQDSVTTQTSTSSGVPDWIQFNACIWDQGEIGDKEFSTTLQWLIDNGIIKI